MHSVNDHNELKFHQPGVFFAGWRIAQNIMRRLIRMVMSTKQELAEAGVYLGKRHT